MAASVVVETPFRTESSFRCVGLQISLKADAASGDMTALGRTYTGLELYSY
jgi:hypothetical protein